jgi:hypothetical protein
LAPDEKGGFDALYGSCKEAEQAKAVMLAGAQPALMFHVLVLDEGKLEAERAAAEMLGGQTLSGINLKPLPPMLPGPPPPPAGARGGGPRGGGQAVHEFRRVCSTLNLTVCIPPCIALFFVFAGVRGLVRHSPACQRACARDNGSTGGSTEGPAFAVSEGDEAGVAFEYHEMPGECSSADLDQL